LMFRSNSVDNAQGWSLNYTSSPYTLLPEMENATYLHLFPNPAQETLNITTTASVRSDYLIEIMNMHGCKVIEQQSSERTGTSLQKIDISQLSEGVYSLRYTSGYTSITRKFVVVR